jgi:DNA-binding NtrC family response regulator
VADEAIPIEVQPVPEPPPVGCGELVLVVDDESMVSTVLQMMLELNGYTAITADNGITALAAFRLRRDEVRLVITDLMMPGMDGAALIHVLHAEAPELKVILFSGLLEPEKRAQIDADGVACILPKPCAADRLLLAVARALAL